ncbi:phosphotransferase [Pseudomonas vancouverensis]|uniref:Aminoglycoside phosphotransferase domain-containing protein n=1 Tax=Pseudomonas vancouverensis TaxID=95300 RepID=A0A1H2MIR4_PSEVA|nr:phosphotransferase [Pseudomonas vancouverensis]KAB0494819.1 hypothetical protein F7R09_19430 [Pseudomonas vancouverensis]TDB63539.1 hypothetical protein EIY72_12690 [Pseudomonas vancouverensis]SDU93100.1 hypothetical protein SAMN05216558_0833 [Pseudomonas vancouverensis]
MLPSNDLEEQVTKTYQLRGHNIQQIYNGVNKVFRITINDKNLTLKIFNKNITTEDNISFERKLTAYLGRHAINCSEPILPASEREKIYTFDQEHYYGILSQEVVGERYSGDNNQHDFMFGQALRRLHSCPVPTFRKQNPSRNDILNFSLDLGHPIRCPYKDKLRETITLLFNHLKSQDPPTPELLHMAFAMEMRGQETPCTPVIPVH